MTNESPVRTRGASVLHWPAMRPPTVFQALSRGAAAVSRTGWLAAVGLLVSGLRSALLLPAADLLQEGLDC